VIVTLTVNPAVDQTVWVDRLTPGGINRSTEVHLDPAGKGINASRMALRLGWPTVAFGFLGGEIGLLVEKALDAEGVQHHFVRVAGQTRINVTINDRRTGRATSLYQPGPAADPIALQRLDEALGFWIPACKVMVLAGSLLPGMPDDWYAQLVRRARKSGVYTLVDADGAPGRLALEAGPHLIKPNLAEAQRLLGRPLPDLPAILDGARELQSRGIEAVVISLGADGAVCVTRDQAWRIRPPAVERCSTVGSGDSLVAGVAVCLARGDGIEEGLRLGTAAGAATALSSGTSLGGIDDVARLLPLVRIEPLARAAASLTVLRSAGGRP
jgi:1-phosphofructokinase family hexose kinase